MGPIAAALTRRTLLGWLGAAAAAAQDVTFRSEVSLVRLLVTVKNAAGELIGGLDKSEFTVTDNGAPQEIAVFERRTEQPLSVAMLLDISGSTAKELRYETDSLLRFARALFGEGNPEDTAGLFTFNWEVVKRAPFTRRLKRIEDGLKNLKAEAGTALYDAILLASEDLAPREGRKVMVVVTDGGDTTSSTDFHRALRAAHRADTVIYVILVMPITNDSGRNVGGENALAQFAGGTGGRVFQPTVGPALDQAFQSILRDLRTQYLVGYYPKNTPLSKNPFHQVLVQLRGAGLRAQTRSGYYGEVLDSSAPPGRRAPGGTP